MQQQQQTAVVVPHLDVLAARGHENRKRYHAAEEDLMQLDVEFGAILNEGRRQFPSDEQFGQWVREHQLDAHDTKNERTAAMWAAANPEQFHETKKANPRVRTVRGLHAKWKAKDKPAPAKVEPTEEDLRTMGRLKTLAERGATEAERESAQSKLDAYSSAFGDDQEEVIEKAAEAVERAREEVPDSTQIQMIKTAMVRAGPEFLADWLLKAMIKDHDLFKSVMERLYK